MSQTQLQSEMLRTRTYTWSDPLPTLSALPLMSGIEWLRSMTEPPPALATVGGETFEVLGEGDVALTLVPAEHHLNPIGTMHGGIIATMLDTVAACAVQTTLAAGMGYTSLDLTTRFLRPVTMKTGRVRAVGTVVSRGSRTAMGEARLTDEDGRLLAHATSTCLLFPLG